MSDSDTIWKNGALVSSDEATVHVSSTALHFGPVAFEGIRCYAGADGGGNLFRLKEHIDRLLASAGALGLSVSFPAGQLRKACADTVLANDHLDAYLRALVFPGSRMLGFGRPAGDAEVCILSFPWHNAHLERAQQRGIRVHVASAIRTEAHKTMSKSKISANYAAGLLAIQEARNVGYDDALLLDASGAVAEASTANVFAVFDGALVTPPASLPILPGITRDTLLVLADELGIEAGEQTFDARRLADADEVFISGTTTELTPVREVDGKTIGQEVPGPITARLLAALHSAIAGQRPDRGWAYPLTGAEDAAAFA